MARTHYEVLGVARAASAAELRRAYLERARLLHPDRHIDAGPAGRAEAERAMQEVTEAWRILGDPGRRRRYDRELGGPAAVADDMDRFASRSDGTFPDEVEVLDPTVHLIRGLPWIVLAIVLVGIFIFTAYATTGGTKKQPPATGSGPTRCVAVGEDAPVSAPCDAPGARTVVTEIVPSAACPAGTEAVTGQAGVTVLCVEV
jgi:curved DNA-binding protein CbpA